jgi:hypothetical protein
VIGPSPSERAEAVLLGQILADEERRAAGQTGGPRLLDQVRAWGITTAGLYGRGYHAEVWRRMCDIAARGGTATRAEVAALLAREARPAEAAGDDGEAPHPAGALMDGTRVHPEIAHPSHLIELTDAAEEAGTPPDRVAAMVVSGAIHRSAHTLSVEVDRAARGEPGTLTQAVTAARDKLARMGGRVAEAARGRPYRGRGGSCRRADPDPAGPGRAGRDPRGGGRDARRPRPRRARRRRPGVAAAGPHRRRRRLDGQRQH